MATNGSTSQAITAEEIDLLSFLRQNIVWKLEDEAAAQGLTRMHPRVIRAVITYFNLGPASNRNFDRLVWRIANGQYVSGSQVTPQLTGSDFSASRRVSIRPRFEVKIADAQCSCRHWQSGQKGCAFERFGRQKIYLYQKYKKQ